MQAMEKHEHEEHNHSHSHSHDVSEIKGVRLILVMLLNFLITAAEIVGGIYSGSLSLISDALHNLTDGLSIIISYLAIKISGRQNDIKRTFGYSRVSIMAALLNSFVLIGISLFLFKEAYVKFTNPQPINGSMIIWVALISLIANALGVILLQKGSHGDMNIKSTYIHLLSDVLSSIGVIVGGILILFFKIYWVDPLLTVLISIYILKESLSILKEAINILMQGTPENIDINKVVADLKKIDGVQDIHHVHVWSLDENNINFEAHLNLENDVLVSLTSTIKESVEHILAEHYGVNHITIQFEYKCCEDVEIIKRIRI
jgi:cobalt-zinc-cadmium efflux system protein